MRSFGKTAGNPDGANPKVAKQFHEDGVGIEEITFAIQFDDREWDFLPESTRDDHDRARAEADG